MTDNNLADLKAMADALTQTSVDNIGRRMLLDEIVGASYVQELATMTEAEAFHYLRSASGEKLLHAYLVLSARPDYALRAHHPVFAEVCLKLMESSKESERIFGAGNLGIWLAGTKDKNASHALALMIANHEERDAVRSEAYTSLELINDRKTVLEAARRNWQERDSPNRIGNEIDWNLVKSFL